MYKPLLPPPPPQPSSPEPSPARKEEEEEDMDVPVKELEEDIPLTKKGYSLPSAYPPILVSSTLAVDDCICCTCCCVEEEGPSNKWTAGSHDLSLSVRDHGCTIHDVP